MQIIDAHVHFFNLEKQPDLPWPPSDSPIRKTTLPSHLQRCSSPKQLAAAIAIEASPRVSDTSELLKLAETESFVLGIVGNLRPDLPDFEDRLHAFARHPKFLGIRLRPISKFDLTDKQLLENLEQLSRYKLTLEFGLPSLDLFSKAEKLADLLPNTTILLDHYGHPNIDGSSPDQKWQQSMRSLAQRPNVYCKVTSLQSRSKTNPPPASLDHYRPLLDFLWETWGKERLIYGSNWPPASTSSSYPEILDLFQSYLTNSPQAAERFFSENAIKAYRTPSP
ncbi:amidohydrolase family protein [Pelagicoccus mobilis]|uniref:Amidohydrolase family protein n=1 Tax=Pelagicoccus mobilis TaxID=415221 RepID=A0A934S0I6_9BACT|nr:amidohydrolase family protein [Pelagicoccus mobilis]MBK1880127.1 amidohydrolase family protein [Pelagicoccus mobilis]